MKCTTLGKESLTLTKNQEMAIEVIRETIMLNDEIEQEECTQMCKGGLTICIKTTKGKEINFHLTKNGFCHSPFLIKRIPTDANK